MNQIVNDFFVVQYNSKVKAGTVGQPAVGMEARIEEDGELLCRGDNLFL
jgi:long-subunit acyl-CoA synthetase (AMP-forming)